MFNAICLLLSAALLFYILKYRVHIHVTIETAPKSRRGGVRTMRNVHQSPQSKMSTVPSANRTDGEARLRDVESAVRNLGGSTSRARAAAAKACKESQDFDQALKLAIQYATQKEAA